NYILHLRWAGEGAQYGAGQEVSWGISAGAFRAWDFPVGAGRGRGRETNFETAARLDGWAWGL
ncbi:MAG: hypothetical protein JW726_07310, partial [Anaerolineales bacterium]|nr:hypothetical protein [Anaerolineales bacterium]